MPIDMHVSTSLDPGLDDELDLLRQAARQVLTSEYPISSVREAASSELRYSEDFWRKMSELGWVGTLIPEADGGASGTILEAGVLAEEMGAALCEAPFVASSVVSAHLLLASGDNPLLQTIANGNIICFTQSAPSDHHGLPQVVRNGDGYVVEGGEAVFVPFAHAADELLVACRNADGADVLLRVSPKDKGVTIRLHETMDWSPLCHVRFDGVEAPADALIAEGEAATSAIAKALELGAVLTCMEQLGGAARCLELANDYAMNRVQFGRPIATFQSIKHRLADMYTSLALARSITYAALRAAADPAPSPMLTAMASVASSDAFTSIARSALQIHGGLGYTWEVDIHLYLRKAAALTTLYGTVPVHLDTIGALLPDLKRKRDSRDETASRATAQATEA